MDHPKLTVQHRLSKLAPQQRPACLRWVGGPHRHEHTAGTTGHPSLCQPGLQDQDRLAWLLSSLNSLHLPKPCYLVYQPKTETLSSLFVPLTSLLLHFLLVQKATSKYIQPCQLSNHLPYSDTMPHHGCRLPEGWNQASSTFYPTARLHIKHILP